MSKQINRGFCSAYLYLEFSAYSEDEGLDGFANQCKMQVQKERDHTILMFQYLQDNSRHLVLEGVARPTVAPDSRLGMLKAGLTHKQYAINLIYTIYDAAYEVKDLRTTQFLYWFVEGQGGEEKTAEGVIKRVELYGNDTKGLYMLNSELAGHAYTALGLVL